MAGRIDYLCDAGSTAVPLIQSDVVKAIANLGPRRATMLPQLAIAREQGVAAVAVYGWNAFFFPKGTPEPIVRALNKAAGEMMEMPGVRINCEPSGWKLRRPRPEAPNTWRVSSAAKSRPGRLRSGRVA